MRNIVLLFLFFNMNISAQNLDFELKNLDNEWINLNDLKGTELTVIDFWATYCKPCVSAIPKINTLYHEFSEKGVNIIGVNVDGTRNLPKVKPFVKALGVDYPIVTDLDKQLMSDLNITTLPTLAIFNRKGKLVYFHEGFTIGDEKIIKNKISKLLGE